MPTERLTAQIELWKVFADTVKILLIGFASATVLFFGVPGSLDKERGQIVPEVVVSGNVDVESGDFTLSMEPIRTAPSDWRWKWILWGGLAVLGLLVVLFTIVGLPVYKALKETAGVYRENNKSEQGGVTHELKTDPLLFELVLAGVKPWELRLDDRGYKEGDLLLLKETRFTGEEMREGAALVYTGRELLLRVVYVLRGPIYGLKEKWCIMTTGRVLSGGN